MITFGAALRTCVTAAFVNVIHCAIFFDDVVDAMADKFKDVPGNDCNEDSTCST